MSGVGATALIHGVEVNEAQARALLKHLRGVMSGQRSAEAGLALAGQHGPGWDAALDFVDELLGEMIAAHTEHIGDAG